MAETNRLINEKSPYLLQHARNPVDWYPWSEEAFEKAGQEDKPVFLSIGYSTCHWCHVMEKESFENSEIAALLNKYFISIKVDREERPDIDHVYMAVCQAMTGHGGWPLTIIMTPDKNPIFAGTYFPKHARWGQPGLMDILGQIQEKWRTERHTLTHLGEDIAKQVAPYLSAPSPGKLSPDTLTKAYDQLNRSFDSAYGGFGPEPKFPTPHNLFFLLRHWKLTGEKKALFMVEKTLRSMQRGGIFDHIGFGFSRYSTDRKWLVPHFEKMLYDNALLAIAYLETFQATGKEEYAGVARDIFTYILRDMTSPEGAFYSAEDADSEGVEGKFYLWTPGEVMGTLGPEKAGVFCALYDITPEGNFAGKCIPNLISASLEEKALQLNLPVEELRGILEECRIKLFRVRERRIHPHKDDKILTAWNSLMVAALAKGAAALEEKKYADAARKAAEFIWKNMRRPDGRLLARHRQGESALNAYLDDYAFFTWGLIELYQATLAPVYLERALTITTQMTDLFLDQKYGGFFFYGNDSEQLFARPKEAHDGALPSGNSVAAVNLLRLARLTGDSQLEEAAQRQLETFAGDIEENPRGHTHFLTAFQFATGRSQEIILAGDPGEERIGEMLNAVRSRFLPHSLLILNPTGSEGEKIKELVPFVRQQGKMDGKVTAYICQGFSCQRPVTETTSLLERMEQ